ncbi:MAG: oligoribonuclease [Planctomycetota bacterium]|nr:MAG: oligoribonuclease [Planctomycetota bacterium]
MADDRLVWMDLEMTGLDPERERILEIASLVTDFDLDEIAAGPELVLRQPDEVLAAMDDWNRRQHAASGLTERSRRSATDEALAETATLEFLRRHVAEGAAPLAGNSVHHDRRFLTQFMPRLAAYLHYRNVDVSTVKELARHWYPAVFARRPPKRKSHRALDDIRESIAELRYYRETIFR